MAGIVGPNIGESGLVFWFDVANPRSYPGSGTVITNLIPEAENLTINNATVSNSVIDFDGVGDSLTFPQTTFASTYTISMWHKAKISTPTTTDPYAFGYLFSLSNSKGIALSEGGTSGDINPGEYYYYNGAVYVLSTAVAQNDVWGNVSIVFNTSVNQVKFYFNGVLNQTTTVSNIDNIYDQIGKWSTGYPWYLYGQMGPFYVYNKELSALQILQNYNALKSRFIN